jgi:hypothetical protein
MTPQASVTSAPKSWGLSASTLKLLGCVFMLIDHVGVILFPDVELFRVIGRLAYPFFAYFIAEGCRYTRNKLKRFLLVLGLGALCEGVYLFMMGELEGGILMNFCFAILLIYQVQAIKKALARGKWGVAILWLLLFMASAAGVYVFSEEVLYVDYGFWGVLIPVWTVLPDYKEGEAPKWLEPFSNRWVKLALFSGGLLLLCISRGLFENIQSFSLLALPLLALYNGQPGRKGLKYGFYIFYPVHLAVLWVIAAILEWL